MAAIRIFVRMLRQWSDHRASAMGAALAYYALFSLAPFLLIAADIAGAFLEEDQVLDRIESYVAKHVDADGASAMRTLAEQARETNRHGGAALLGGVLLFFGALGAFLHLRTSFCTIWDLAPPRGSSVLGFLFDYVLAGTAAFAMVGLLMASLLAGVLAPILRVLLRRMVPELEADLWIGVELLGNFLFLTLLFASLYRVLSGRRLAWRYGLGGAFFAAAAFSGGKFGVTWWLARSAAATSFGIFSSLMVLLIWLWFSAQAIFLGAEFAQAIRTGGAAPSSTP